MTECVVPVVFSFHVYENSLWSMLVIKYLLLIFFPSVNSVCNTFYFCSHIFDFSHNLGCTYFVMIRNRGYDKFFMTFIMFIMLHL